MPSEVFKTVSEVTAAYAGGRIGRKAARALIREFGEDPDDFIGEVVGTVGAIAGAVVGASLIGSLFD